MSILRMPPLLPSTPPCRNLSSISFSTDQISQLSIKPSTITFNPSTNFTTIIRMGGGPRTFPGGVSKWQWKRMQLKKQKQLLKARLCRERQIYEMRKRTELRAAVSELERPWEVVERAPSLFSVSADEQLKVLADRFQKPGGYDLWGERDGPQLFQTADGFPSARFFPKGVVHSVKPYGIQGDDGLEDGDDRKLRNGGRRRLRGKGYEPRGVSGLGNDNLDVQDGLNNLRISSGREERNGRGSSSRGSGGFSNVEGRLNNLRISSGNDERDGKGLNPRSSSRLNNLRISSGSEERLESRDGKGSSRGARRKSEKSYGSNNLRSSSGREERNGNSSRGSLRYNVESGNSYGLNKLRNSSSIEKRDGNNSHSSHGGLKNKGARRNVETGNSYGLDSKKLGYDTENRRTLSGERGRSRSSVRQYDSSRGQRKPRVTKDREVYDMSLKRDGSYGIQNDQDNSMLMSGGIDDDFDLDLSSWRNSGS